MMQRTVIAIREPIKIRKTLVLLEKASSIKDTNITVAIGHIIEDIIKEKPIAGIIIYILY
jgi:hypothetical protein